MPNPETTHRGYPQPHADNTLAHDVERISTAIEMIDQDINDTKNQQSTDTLDINKKLHRIRLNTLLNENLFII